jgi:hypothetical protein
MGLIVYMAREILVLFKKLFKMFGAKLLPTYIIGSKYELLINGKNNKIFC